MFSHLLTEREAERPLAVIPDSVHRESNVLAFSAACAGARRWIPAFAGMTEREDRNKNPVNE